MTKYEWDRQLRKLLKDLPADERQRVFEYYDELFEDKIDAGDKEEDIIAGFGSPEFAAKKILSDYRAYLDREDISQTRTEQGDVGDLKESNKERGFCGEYDRTVKENSTARVFAEEDASDARYEGVRKLKIDVSISDVIIRRKAGARIDLGGEDKDFKCTLDVGGDTLYLKEKGTSFWKNLGIGVKSKKIFIDLPTLESVSFDSNRCSCEIDGFDMRRVTLNTVGGDLKVNGCSTGYMSLSTTGGDIAVDGGTHASVNISTTTGDIRVREIEATGLTATAMSGDIICEDVKVQDKILLKTVSGEVTARKADCGNIESKTVTGDNTLELSGNESDYTVTVNSMTGSVESPRGGNGSKRVSVSTVTGNIYLKII